MLKKIFKIALIFLILSIGVITYYVGYKSNLIIEMPKNKPDLEFGNNRAKHFVNDNLSFNDFEKIFVTKTPKIYVFWTGWCGFSKDFLNKTEMIYKKYPNIEFVFVNLDKEINKPKSDSLHLFYNIKSKSYRIATENKFMDLANHKSIIEFMNNINSDFEKHPGLPYFIGINKTGEIISEIAGFENEKTFVEFDEYLKKFNE